MKRLLPYVMLTFISPVFISLGFMSLAYISLPSSVEAKEAVPMAADPVIEVRMLEIASELRCLVCQNESLAASQADFAVDLRREIRDMLNKGMTEDQIVDFMVQRYGDFIRFRPPMKPITVLLWFGPLILLLIGGSVLVVNIIRRRRRLAATVQISEQDIQRAEKMLATGNHEDDREDHKS